MELNDYAVRLFGFMQEVEDLKFFGDPAKFSKTEGRLLREVITEYAKGRDIISSELSRRLGVTRSAVSQLVTKLEEEGYLQRAAAPDDRKIAYVRLSDSAMEAFETKCRELNALLDACAARFGKDRMQRLSVDSADFIALVKEAHKQASSPENEKA